MPEVKNTFTGQNTSQTSQSIHFLLNFLYKYTAFKWGYLQRSMIRGNFKLSHNLFPKGSCSLQPPQFWLILPKEGYAICLTYKRVK